MIFLTFIIAAHEPSVELGVGNFSAGIFSDQSLVRVEPFAAFFRDRENAMSEEMEKSLIGFVSHSHVEIAERRFVSHKPSKSSFGIRVELVVKLMDDAPTRVEDAEGRVVNSARDEHRDHVDLDALPEELRHDVLVRVDPLAGVLDLDPHAAARPVEEDIVQFPSNDRFAGEEIGIVLHVSLVVGVLVEIGEVPDELLICPLHRLHDRDLGRVSHPVGESSTFRLSMECRELRKPRIHRREIGRPKVIPGCIPVHPDAEDALIDEHDPGFRQNVRIDTLRIRTGVRDLLLEHSHRRDTVLLKDIDDAVRTERDAFLNPLLLPVHALGRFRAP
jgi:hypothetical protein